jgi:multiple sugar transport system substrate-binding protein
MTLYTLLAHSGHPGNVDGPILFEREAGCQAYETLQELTGLISESCWTSDPIAVFESMSRSDSPVACAPYIYGYVNYALNGFRPMRIAFADIPVEQGRPPHGSALGGTGIAVSARTGHPDQARDFAYWLASADVQRTLYASSGGQPGHASAWEDDDVNEPVLDFYRATRATLEGAWVRPRHDGYMAFQQAASDRLNQGLRGGEPAGVVIDALNALFASSLHGGKGLDSAQEHTGARNARGVVQG